MKKNKIFKVLAMVMILTMMFSVNVFATETQSMIMPRSQGYDGSFTENYSLPYSDELDNTHYLTYNAHCDYTVAWDEGYSGWVTDAVFSVSNTKANGIVCSFNKQYVSSCKCNGTAKMDYKVNYSDYYVRVYVSCDEWGNVDYGSYRINSSQLCDSCKK